MENRNFRLRGLIYGKFESEAELARVLGWTRQRLNLLTTRQKEPDLNELKELSGALDISVYELVNIFLE